MSRRSARGLLTDAIAEPSPSRSSPTGSSTASPSPAAAEGSVPSVNETRRSARPHVDRPRRRSRTGNVARFVEPRAHRRSRGKRYAVEVAAVPAEGEALGVGQLAPVASRSQGARTRPYRVAIKCRGGLAGRAFAPLTATAGPAPEVVSPSAPFGENVTVGKATAKPQSRAGVPSGPDVPVSGRCRESRSPRRTLLQPAHALIGWAVVWAAIPRHHAGEALMGCSGASRQVEPVRRRRVLARLRPPPYRLHWRRRRVLRLGNGVHGISEDLRANSLGFFLRVSAQRARKVLIVRR